MMVTTIMPRMPRTVLFLVLLLLIPGCLRRRMIVRSNPSGATVYIDNQQIGTTPCSTDFIYYGTRELRLVKPGYETLTINQPIPTPWYEIPPIDFVSENLIPHEIQDYRTLSYNMVPQVIVPTEQLLNRAQQLRQATNHGLVTPASSMTPAVETIAPGLPGTSGGNLPPPSTVPPVAPGGQSIDPYASPPIQHQIPAPGLAPSVVPTPNSRGESIPPAGPLPAPVRY